MLKKEAVTFRMGQWPCVQILDWSNKSRHKQTPLLTLPRQKMPSIVTYTHIFREIFALTSAALYG
jgi:hypothetical protein